MRNLLPLMLCLIGCSENMPAQEKYEAGKVLVQFQDDVSLQDAFSFFNQRSLVVDAVRSLSYRSPFPADSAGAIVDAFSSRLYISKDSRRVTIDGDGLNVMVTLNSVTTALQSDWVHLAVRFRFAQYGNTHFFVTKVPVGETQAFVKALSAQREVKSASLSYVRDTF